MFLKITAYIEIQSNVLTYTSVDDNLTTLTVGQLWLLFWKSDVRESYAELGNKTGSTAGKPCLAQFA